VQLNEVITYTSDQGLALKAGDRMASGKGLVLDVASLDNGGELLSDGDLSITTGDMTNTGRASALQTLTVTAHNLTQNGGRLAGTNTRLNLTGTLDSLGFLTARQQLDIAAAQINNRGTLGAQGAVNLTAVNGITNAADSLLFSGGNLTLRANGFSNLHGDVYSKGNLTFAARDGGRAAGFSNLSGTVESEGNIGIDAAFVENAKAEFELGKTITTGRVQWICGQHCKGHDWFKRGLTIIDQTYLEAAVKDSAPARLVAGGDMLIQGDNVQNRYSLMAANRNLSIAANDLLNQGAGTRTGQNHIVIGNAQKIDTDYWDWVEFTEIPAFNAALAAGKFDLAKFEALKARSSDYRFFEASNVTTWTSNGGHEYDATLQAGGTVDLSNVTRKAQNGTLHENTLAQLAGSLGDDQTGIPVGGININLSTHANDPGAQAPGSVLPVVTPAAGGGFVPVDYTGAAFASVDPTTSPNFQVPKGEYGLFVKNPDPTSHYLIETNPEFASLTGFFSSDYMLGKLGYSSDNAWRRLGDGQYESRLIRDAVLAQTGQRFLAGGLYSDADQFRYLMDNALASKDALRLSLGVTLTSQQVGALTHDIVWMENRVVDGQTVLVPVLYLAQAESRNVRGNSLIQGRDLNLFTGGDLINVGTLRASNNLSAAAGGSLYNGGLIEAGNNLTLLAQDSIRNAMAGEIRGKQVSLTALKGDITNETTAIQVRDGAGMRTLTDGSGGTIVARENLAMDAGRDLTNRGALTAGNDANLTAGRDLNLIAASDTRVKHEFSDGGHKSSITTDVKNLAASVTAGGSINMQAGQDVNIIGSTATAGKDLTIAAGRDLNIASVSDMHNVDGKEKHGKKRIKTADEQTTQVASVLTAGGDFVSQAGRDTTIVASRISAGNEAYLYSGDKLSLLAAQNSTHTLYDMKKNSGWGSKKTQRDEVTRITNVGTEIKTGGDLILKSEGDQTYQLAKLQSGKDITLDSGGAITFEAVKDLHQESHEKSNNNAFWVSSKGKGNTDETVRQSQLIAEGNVAIKAVAGLKIDINQVNQETVSQSIDAMVKADPQLAWIKDAEKRGDVDWRQVKEIHDSFKYSNSGLGPASQIIIAIVMAAVVGPLAAGAMGTATGGMVAAGTMTANTATFISAASGAVAAGAATNATVSVINNRGNLGAVFKDVTSSDAMKGYVISGVTAGLTAAYFDGWTGTKTEYGTGNITSPPLNTWTGVGQFAASQTLQNGTSMLVGKALGQGGSGSDALKSALFNTLAAVSFNAVGDYTKGRLTEGYPPKIIVHAMVGGLLAEATGGDFKTGALAAGVNEAVVGHLSSLVHGDKTLLSMSSQVIGVLAAATQKDADAESLEKGGWVAKNATQYNHSLHEMQTVALDELRRRDPENKAKYDAAACALTHCSASVPKSDENYKTLVELENEGNEFTKEIALLKSTGQFDYTFKDRIDDALSANDELFTNVGYAASAAGGAGAGTLSYIGMVGASPACVSIVGCAAPFALGAMGTVAFAGAAASYDQIGAPYTSTEGGRVLASLHPEQYPGEASPLGDLSQRAAESLAELAVAHYGGKALSGELSSVIKNGVNPNAATKGQPVFGGGTDNEAGTLVERNVIEGTSKGAKGGGSSGFSGGKPTIVDDPYSPNAVTERSSVNRDYYGRENAADEFSAGLPDYATHSTAKSYQSTAPRDLNEQTLWNRVTENPSAGRDTKLAGDKDFPRSEGWRKMEVSHRLPSGENITIHYQYNSVTDKAYDMKITTPQQLPPVLQPGRTIE
jgi:filamentous hemagglutinin